MFQLVMIIAMSKAAIRGAIQCAMVVVSHNGCRSWDDSACHDHLDVKTQPLVGRFNSRWLSCFINVAARGIIQLALIIELLKEAARGTIQFAMGVLPHKRRRSWDDSAFDDHQDVEMQPPVGRFNLRWLS